jgi:hypothetical protein
MSIDRLGGGLGRLTIRWRPERSQLRHRMENSPSDQRVPRSATLLTPVGERLGRCMQKFRGLLWQQQRVIVKLHDKCFLAPGLRCAEAGARLEPSRILWACRGRQAVPPALRSIDQLRRRHHECGPEVFWVMLG